MDNPVTLSFGVVTNGAQLPEGAEYQITDKLGETLSILNIDGDTALAENISVELFKDDSRWPLQLSLDAEAFTMPTVQLNKADFLDAPDDQKRYQNPLTLSPLAFCDLNTQMLYNGQAVKISPTLIQKNLYAEKTTLDWKITILEDKVRVLLPPGETFPVNALLSIPEMKEINFAISSDKQPEWNLLMDERDVFLHGLGQFTQLKFLPDLTKVRDIDIRNILQENAVEYTTTPQQLSSGVGSWSLPKLAGKVEVTDGDKSWSFPLSAEAKYRVLTAANKSGSLDVGSSEFLELTKRAEGGDLDSQYELAMAYLNGAGAPKSPNASTAWFEVAAERGDKAAQHNLALAYELGTGVAKNQRAAVKWYALAAKQGYSDSQMGLALCYQQGRGTEQSYKEAEGLFLKAAEQGNPSAMFNLAILYEDEKAGMVDKAKAIQFYQTAADKGHVGALYNLAWSYENGEGGLTADRDKAIELYRKAADKGSNEAKEALNALTQ